MGAATPAPRFCARGQVPILNPTDVLRYLRRKGFLSAGEVELVESRWSADREGPLLPYLAREKILPEEVAEDLITLIGNGQLEGLEPVLPGLILLQMVGRGGRGSVYRAWQTSLRRVVAVKILNKGLVGNREYIQRFLREARVASKVNHRNIVRAFDINKKGGNVYMVMEYVSGRSVGEILHHHPKLAPADALEIAYQTGEAIAYAARVGIVHRDIKPDNIMIDRKGRVKLCDLGLARPAGATSLTAPMVAQGTPNYMAPEAAISPEIDSQADVYSLGVTLYRMLLGRVPFEHSDPVEVLRMHVEEPVEGLESNDLPGALSDLMRRMLEKSPSRRPDAKSLPREIGALMKTLPGMEKHRLWDLVPGGAPTAHIAEAQLALEPTDEMQRVPAAPVYDPVPAITSTPSTRLTLRSNRLTVAAFTVMAVALVVSLAYIIVSGVGGPAATNNEETIDALRERVTTLTERLDRQTREQKRIAELMREAMDRLEAENREDAQHRSDRPARDTSSDVMEEIRELERIHALQKLPGG